MQLTKVLWATLLMGSASAGSPNNPEKPNIIFIITDDQDRRLGSTDFQEILQREMISKGTEFVNHHSTTAVCCPSRASILRGQLAHNTNITHVHLEGGNYLKWMISRQDEDYLPFWVKKAGYRAEWVGKLLNGIGVFNWFETPKGWDWIDTLLDPYTTFANIPIMSQNCEKPIYYKGWHQADVVRIKALARLEELASGDEPFFMGIAPYAPHVQNDQFRAIPLQRHAEMFPDAKAPRSRNWNPEDTFQKSKGSWLRDLPLMNKSVIEWADYSYRSRAQSLQSVDEIIEDVTAMLERHGIAENTYIVYTSDQGYHIGQHRIPAGKSLFYAEDTNVPLAIRGPGVPAGLSSSLPGTHVDLAPTFLDIMGLPKEEWPVFFDGTSLLSQWKAPSTNPDPDAGAGTSRESINVEYWGWGGIEAPNSAELIQQPIFEQANSYKTIRVLGDGNGDNGTRTSWLYTKWCTGDAELYDTGRDEHELENLASSEDPYIVNVLNRLNGLLLVTKSCEQGSCRDPWSVLFPAGNIKQKVTNLGQAMNPAHDAFFAALPRVKFGECMRYQYAPNEEPFLPPLPEGGEGGLGRAHRGPTDNYEEIWGRLLIEEDKFYGDEGQRGGTVEDIYRGAREWTEEEMAAVPYEDATLSWTG